MAKREMNIATIIFTYQRPQHTQEVINSLQNNDMKPQKLFLFQDGKCETTNIEKWGDTNKVIKEINWCDTEVIISDKNKGLAEAIVSGINYVLQTYDAVIVLEDDCVTHPQFMEYMFKALTKYEMYERVWGINGYSWPVEVEPNGTDAYFAGRSGSWGWGTWKNRWKDYKEDYKILKRIKSNEYAREQFYIWGRDLEGYLHGNIDGTCNSWAVFKSLLVLEKNMYCLTPYHSLVKNIGFDGTGEHCGAEERKNNFREIRDRREIILPDQIDFPNDYEKAYRNVFRYTPKEVRITCYFNILYDWIRLKNKSKSIVDYLCGQNISSVSIWGKGQISELLIEELEGIISVAAIIESTPTSNRWHNFQVKDMMHIPKETQLVIVIPIFDLEKIKKTVNELYSDLKIVGIDELIHGVQENAMHM